MADHQRHPKGDRRGGQFRPNPAADVPSSAGPLVLDSPGETETVSARWGVGHPDVHVEGEDVKASHYISLVGDPDYDEFKRQAFRVLEVAGDIRPVRRGNCFCGTEDYCVTHDVYNPDGDTGEQSLGLDINATTGDGCYDIVVRFLKHHTSHNNASNIAEDIVREIFQEWD